jgi:hypothetical protein
MTTLSQIASALGRRDEAPNQELARSLAASGDAQGIAEIAAGLQSLDKGVQADCIKVLYEIGYLRPDLVSAHASAFLKLLASKNNRLVWGGMIALSTVAALAADVIYKRADDIIGVMERGSVITIDNGIKTLALLSAAKPRYAEQLFPYLLNHLKTCREKDAPQHAEHILAAVNAGNKDAYIAVVTRRLAGAPASRAARLRKALQIATAL